MSAENGWSILKTCLITLFVIAVIQGWAAHDRELAAMREVLKAHGIDVPVKIAGR